MGNYKVVQYPESMSFRLCDVCENLPTIVFQKLEFEVKVTKLLNASLIVTILAKK